MSTASVQVPGAPWFKPKYLLAAFFLLLFVYVLVHNESFLINSRAAVWRHYRPFKWWLLPHGLAGACALLLGPMQFSDRLRKRYAKLHRVVGRIYVAGALIASPLGFVVQFVQWRLGAPASFSLIAATHGSLWAMTTAVAFAFILKGNVQQHRQWMTRSFLVGPGVFLGARVMLGVTGLEGSSPLMLQAVIFCCIAFSIPLADIILSWQELWRSRSPVRRRSVAASAVAIL